MADFNLLPIDQSSNEQLMTENSVSDCQIFRSISVPTDNYLLDLPELVADRSQVRPTNEEISPNFDFQLLNERTEKTWTNPLKSISQPDNVLNSSPFNSDIQNEQTERERNLSPISDEFDPPFVL